MSDLELLEKDCRAVVLINMSHTLAYTYLDILCSVLTRGITFCAYPSLFGVIMKVVFVLLFRGI